MLFKPLAPHFYIVKLGFTWVYIFPFFAKYHLFHLKIHGRERTSQSRDQNIEIEYNLGNFVSLRTGKIDVFNALVVRLRRIASAKYENNYMLVIFAYLIILHLTGFANIPLQGILLHLFLKNE